MPSKIVAKITKNVQNQLSHSLQKLESFQVKSKKLLMDAKIILMQWRTWWRKQRLVLLLLKLLKMPKIAAKLCMVIWQTWKMRCLLSKRLLLNVKNSYKTNQWSRRLVRNAVRTHSPKQYGNVMMYYKSVTKRERMMQRQLLPINELEETCFTHYDKISFIEVL